MMIDDDLRRSSQTILDVEKIVENLDFQVFSRCVQGRLGCVNLSSVVSGMRSRASGDQLFVEQKKLLPERQEMF